MLKKISKIFKNWCRNIKQRERIIFRKESFDEWYQRRLKATQQDFEKAMNEIKHDISTK